MKKMEIFDPAMCCSTGVCGTSIDSELLRVSGIISALGNKGILIERHGLSQEPQAFVDNKLINNILQKDGSDLLPITVLNGKIVKTHFYPTNAEFSKWLEIDIDEKKEPKKRLLLPL